MHLVVLAVVDGVAPGQDELGRRPSDGTGQAAVKGAHERVEGVWGEGLLGALHGDQLGESGIEKLAVEELEAGGRLDIAHVEVGHVGDAGDRSPPTRRKRRAVARRRRAGLTQQFGADHVLLSPPRRDRAVRSLGAPAQDVARAEGPEVGERHRTYGFP